jgi:hypothetical protein
VLSLPAVFLQEKLIEVPTENMFHNVEITPVLLRFQQQTSSLLAGQAGTREDSAPYAHHLIKQLHVSCLSIMSLSGLIESFLVLDRLATAGPTFRWLPYDLLESIGVYLVPPKQENLSNGMSNPRTLVAEKTAGLQAAAWYFVDKCRHAFQQEECAGRNHP